MVGRGRISGAKFASHALNGACVACLDRAAASVVKGGGKPAALPDGFALPSGLAFFAARGVASRKGMRQPEVQLQVRKPATPANEDDWLNWECQPPTETTSPGFMVSMCATQSGREGRRSPRRFDFARRIIIASLRP